MLKAYLYSVPWLPAPYMLSGQPHIVALVMFAAPHTLPKLLAPIFAHIHPFLPDTGETVINCSKEFMRSNQGAGLKKQAIDILRNQFQTKCLIFKGTLICLYI